MLAFSIENSFERERFAVLFEWPGNGNPIMNSVSSLDKVSKVLWASASLFRGGPIKKNIENKQNRRRDIDVFFRTGLFDMDIPTIGGFNEYSAVFYFC